MKKNLHPNWYPNAKFTCSCGNTFTTGATVETARVAICSACHPIFTGQEKLIDTEGLVQKFQKRQKVSEQLQKNKVQKTTVKETREKESTSRPKTLKDMLTYAKKQL